MPARRENRSMTASTARKAGLLGHSPDPNKMPVVAIHMDDGAVLECRMWFNGGKDIYPALADAFSNRIVTKYTFTDDGGYAGFDDNVKTKRIYENDIVGYCLSAGTSDHQDKGRAPWFYRTTERRLG